MFPRKETKWIVVSATMTPKPMLLQEITWRDRRYGFIDIANHFVILGDGSIENGRPHHIAGTAVRPHNATSVSILLSGSPPFTDDQMDALADVVTGLVDKYPQATVVGLKDLPGARSEAPGFDVASWYTGLKAVNAL